MLRNVVERASQYLAFNFPKAIVLYSNTSLQYFIIILLFTPANVERLSTMIV